MKTINSKQTVYEICNLDLAVIEILVEIGFKDLTKPGMLNTAGRFMTLEKGAAMKKIDMDTIKQKFLEYGYKLL